MLYNVICTQIVTNCSTNQGYGTIQVNMVYRSDILTIVGSCWVFGSAAEWSQLRSKQPNM